MRLRSQPVYTVEVSINIEPTIVAVVIVAVNMIGSIALTWLRYYYRAHYHLKDGPDSERFNGKK